MSIEKAVYPVLRDGVLYHCAGEDLESKVKDTDLFVCQQGDGQFTFVKDDLKDFGADASERSYDEIKDNASMTPNTAIWLPSVGRFLTGELMANNRSKWLVSATGKNVRKVGGSTGPYAPVSATIDFAADKLVTSHEPRLFRAAETVDIQNLSSKNEFPYVDSADKPQGALQCAMLQYVQKADGTGVYVGVRRIWDGSSVSGSNIVKDKLYIYDNYDDLVSDTYTEVNCPFQIDAGVMRAFVDNENGHVYWMTDNAVWVINTNDFTKSKKVVNPSSYPSFRDIAFHGEYYYVVSMKRDIYWGKRGEIATNNWEIPKEIAGIDHGFYPPSPGCMAIVGDEAFIGSDYGSILTAKITNSDPSAWEYSEEIYTYGQFNSGHRFSRIATNDEGTILIAANDYIFMATLPEFVIPCTDEDGITKKVDVGDFAKLLESEPMPWDGHNGGIFHVKDVSNTFNLGGGPFTAWDVDGTNERQITQVEAGKELVFVTPENLNGLFRDSQATWEFGKYTNTSNVTNMYILFYNARKFNGDISNWDVSNVVDMERMFRHAYKFNSNISNWNVSNVRNMAYLFLDAGEFNQSIGNWDVSNVEQMSFMFANARKFNRPIGNWNVVNAKKMWNMFSYATTFNKSISNWDVSNVTNMQSMFSVAQRFNQDISNWNVSNVTDMTSMFYWAKAFNRDLSQWCVNPEPNHTDFDLEATNWTQPKPVWGTCPRGENQP